MAKRRNMISRGVPVGGGGRPRANWWKQTLGTDYFNRGSSIPDWILSSGEWDDDKFWRDEAVWID